MRWHAAGATLVVGLGLAACGSGAGTVLDAAVSDAALDGATVVEPVANPAREVLNTALALDVTAHTGSATITFGPSDAPGASLEAEGLTITAVTLPDQTVVPFLVFNQAQLQLGLAASPTPVTVAITYSYALHGNFMGQSAAGYTLIWPDYCGNVFPCHSQPDDGTTFQVTLSGVPAGKTAVYPTVIPEEAPAYQVAWSIDAYTELALGATTAGTQLSAWYRPGEETAARTGTVNLVAAFDWYERVIGPYRFGPKAGTVSVNWGAGQFGGMEHHPFWHVGSGALASEDTSAHEAAHGWYGDGIRLQCWEDFVLSEGTVSYLSARAMDVVAPSVGAATWQGYRQELASLPGTLKVWPQSCGVVDVNTIFTRAPYIRGAFFYRALADKLGAAVVDDVLHQFYAAHAGKAARMSDMLQTIRDVTGYDPTVCAATWLTSTTRPTPGPCP